jgi:hypothetical protein
MQLLNKIALIITLAAYAANAQVTSVVTVPGMTATGATITFPPVVSTIVVSPPPPPPAATGTTAAGPAPPAGTGEGTGSSSPTSVSTGYVPF